MKNVMLFLAYVKEKQGDKRVGTARSKFFIFLCICLLRSP